MSTDANRDPPARPGVRPAAIAVAAIALIALISFLGYQTFTPRVYAPPAPPPRADPTRAAFNTWAKQRYHETNGDWSKLPPQDQQRFIEASRGQGKSLFASFKP